MALGFSNTSGGGDILPRVQYDARAGRLFKVERTQDPSGAWISNKVDVTNDQPTFIVDFGSISVGFAAFLPTGPDFHMAPLGQPMPARPTPDHKQGFVVKLYSPKFFDGIREFSSSSKAVLSAIDGLHSEFEGAPEAAAGKVPVVQFAGATPIVSKGPQGTTTNYAPTFKVVSWVERPAELGDRTVPAPGGQIIVRPAPTASAPVSNHVPPPVMAPPAATAAPNAMPF